MVQVLVVVLSLVKQSIIMGVECEMELIFSFMITTSKHNTIMKVINIAKRSASCAEIYDRKK